MILTLADGHLILNLNAEECSGSISMFVDETEINDGFRRYCRTFKSIDKNSYEVSLPHYLVGGKETCEVRFQSACRSESETKLSLNLSQLAQSTSSFVGNIDYMDSQRINGWVLNKNSDSPVKFELYVDGEFYKTVHANLRRDDVHQHFDGVNGLFTGFNVIWNPKGISRGFELRESDSGQCLLGTPVMMSKATESIKFLENAISEARKSGIANPLGSSGLADQFFGMLRKQPKFQLGAANSCDPANAKLDYGLSVIVPVYNGYEVLVDCIESLASSKSETDYEIIVVNDCSTDTRIAGYLKEIQERIPDLFFINRQTNGGFVETANMGLQARRYSHAVLLNSDTLVPLNFVDRLLAAHEKSPEFGVLTPLSNNATIYSFPRSLENNGISGLDDVYRIDKTLRKEASGVIHEMPTGHGFCMFISGEVLATIGQLDAQEWGKGYGEENDYCQKAKMAGWKIGAVTSMYVGHVGSVSFGVELREKQLARNLSLLSQRYPEYDDLIREHIFEKKEFQSELNRLQIETVIADSNLTRSGAMVFVTHALGGGTDEYIDRCAIGLEEDNVSTFRIIVETDGRVVLEDNDSNFKCVFSENEYDLLLGYLKKLGVIELVLNSVFTMPFSLVNAVLQSGISFVAVIHDYSWLCPRVNLIDARESFCNLPSVDVCNTCVKVSGPHDAVARDRLPLSKDVLEWRNDSLHVLERARLVICPSKDTESRILSIFPTINSVVKYHQDRFPIPVMSASSRKIRSKDLCDQTIAIFGRIGNHKGMAVLKNLIWLLSARNDGVKFVFYGELAEYSWLKGYTNVEFAGEYEKNSLNALVTESAPTIALFLSVWPETYCYALTDAISNGVYPIAFDIGAFRERMSMHNFGGVIPYTTNSEDIYSSIVQVISSESFLNSDTKDVRSGSDYSSTLNDYFDIDSFTKANAA